MEVWKLVNGYGGKYSVSNLGNVRNNDTQRLVKSRVRKDGYVELRLFKRGEGKKGYKWHNVHRLVALAHVPGYQPGLHVDHDDTNKANNVSTNLIWMTQKANSVKALAGTYTAINPQGVQVTIYNLREFCKNNNLPRTSFTRLLKGEYREYRGWKTAV